MPTLIGDPSGHVSYPGAATPTAFWSCPNTTPWRAQDGARSASGWFGPRPRSRREAEGSTVVLESAMFLDGALLVRAQRFDEPVAFHPLTWDLPWPPTRRQAGKRSRGVLAKSTLDGAGALVATPASVVKVTCNKVDMMFNHDGP